MFDALNKNLINSITYCLLLAIGLTFSGYANAKQPIQSAYNIKYNQQGQLLDLYLPQARDKETAILFIHGGGFKFGSKQDMAGYAKRYAEGGFVTTSVNYRLSPAHTYPAAVNDVKDALAWMKDNAAKYGYDPKKIVVVGYSAGATLALNLGLDHTQQVAAAISVAPVTDIGPLIEEAPYLALRAWLKAYMGDIEPIKASPIAQVTEHSSPVFLFHGDKDNIVPTSQSVLMAKKLKAHNIPVLLRVFPNAGHEIMQPNKHFNQLLKEMTDFIMAVEASSSANHF